MDAGGMSQLPHSPVRGHGNGSLAAEPEQGGGDSGGGVGGQEHPPGGALQDHAAGLLRAHHPVS